MNATGSDQNYAMKPVEQRVHSKSHHDIMTLRLKNRERQRRYRARKRLEAEIKKSCALKETPPLLLELQSNGTYSDRLTRIYCNRKWKKDARRAHTAKVQETMSTGMVIASTTQSIIIQGSCALSGNKAGSSLDRGCHLGSSDGVVDHEPCRVVLSRRDWKAEARKKKD